jgi:hypothetical protein
MRTISVVDVDNPMPLAQLLSMESNAVSPSKLSHIHMGWNGNDRFAHKTATTLARAASMPATTMTTLASRFDPVYQRAGEFLPPHIINRSTDCLKVPLSQQPLPLREYRLFRRYHGNDADL